MNLKKELYHTDFLQGKWMWLAALYNFVVGMTYVFFGYPIYAAICLCCFAVLVLVKWVCREPK